MIKKNTFKQYRAMKGVNASILKYMDVPLIAKYWQDSPHDKETKAKLIGRAFHAMMECPYQFQNEFYVADLDLRTKEGKADKEKIIKHFPSHVILESSIARQVMDMRTAVMSIKQAATTIDAVEEKRREFSVQWVEDQVKCKGRVDLYFDGIIYDYKTTSNLDQFYADLAKYNYPLQAAHYMAGCAANGLHAEDFCWIVVTTYKPYQAVMFYCNQTTLEAGNNDRIAKLSKYKECMDNGIWPGVEAIQQIDAPSWYLEKHLVE